MYDVFYYVLQLSLKDLQHHYMDTDSFVLSYTEGTADKEHMDLSNLEKFQVNSNMNWELEY